MQKHRDVVENLTCKCGAEIIKAGKLTCPRCHQSVDMTFESDVVVDEQGRWKCQKCLEHGKKPKTLAVGNEIQCRKCKTKSSLIQKEEKVEEKVIQETKIEGDLVFDGKVIFENDIEITGSLKVKEVLAKKDIYVHRDYLVERRDEVGAYQRVSGFQEVGAYQKVGRSQIVGGSQIVGAYQTVGGSQTVGGYQKVSGFQEVGRSQIVGESQKVGWFQKVGEYQLVGGDIVVGTSICIGYYIKAKGKIVCGEQYRIFAGVAARKDCPEDQVIEATEVQGEVGSGIVKLISPKIKITINGQEKEVSPEQAEKIKQILG